MGLKTTKKLNVDGPTVATDRSDKKKLKKKICNSIALRYRHLLRREFVQVQSIRVRYRWRHRLPVAQGQVLLRLPPTTDIMPSCLGKIFSSIFRHEDGACSTG